MPGRRCLIISMAVVLCVAFVAFAAAGCRPAAPSAVIRFGYIAADQLHSPAVMVMKEKKLLEAAGFAVEWVEYLAGVHAVQDMSAGLLDFAACGAVPVMISRSQGVDLAIIAGANQEGSGLVVDESIRTAKELDGKKIAVPGFGSIQDAMLIKLARDNDIRINRVVMEVSDMPTFLKEKEIDGFIAWEPHPSKALDQKAGHELLTSRDMMSGHQCCVLATLEDTLRSDPETVDRVLGVYLDAFGWIEENRAEAIKLMAKNTGMTEEIVHRALEGVSHSFPPYCNTESMRAMAQGLVEASRMTIKEEELDSFVDGLYRPEFLDKIFGG